MKIKFLTSGEMGFDDFGNPTLATTTVLGSIEIKDENFQDYRKGMEIKIAKNASFESEVKQLFLEPVPSFYSDITMQTKLQADTEENLYSILFKKSFDTHSELIVMRGN